MGENDEIIREFVLESTENLDQLERGLAELEHNPSSPEILSSIFRTVHTIKGATGFLGFSKLESLAHCGEGLLGLLRDHKLSLTRDMTAALLDMAAAAREMLAAIQSTGCDGEEDYPDVAGALRRFQEPASRPTGADAQSRSRSAAQSPESAPPEAPLPLGQILIRSGYATAADVDAALEAQRAGDPRYLGEILVERGVVASHIIRAAMEEQVQGSSFAANTIRVELEQLQKLASLVDELALARDQMMGLTLSHREPSLHSLLQRLDSITAGLEAAVMKTRMQSLDSLWVRVARMARDLAASCGKQVKVSVEGNEIELDRAIIEAVRDPLLHIVRNAVDHGIQAPAQRADAGKPPEGHISIRAYHNGGMVVLDVSDDGEGVDLDRVKQIAIGRGLVTPEQTNAMGMRELCELIFVPGFSTAAKVTHISGRGVGMDVVRTNIARIGGTVEVESKTGRGLSLKMKLPVRLATVPAVMLACSGERFAIPQGSLIEIIRLEAARAAREIAVMPGGAVHWWRSRQLPLIYLDQELGIRTALPNGASGPDEVHIAVLESDNWQFALAVDEIGEKEDIVEKPLDEQLKHLSVYAGAAVMSDGKIALILDVASLAARTKRQNRMLRQAAPDSQRNASNNPRSAGR